ncbi:MAG: hypothetical protein ABR499_10560 [Gemmatimonadaceae bacterium]
MSRKKLESSENVGEPGGSEDVERSRNAGEDSASQTDAAARLFYERLEQLGQLIDVDADTDLAALPPHVTHVRYPNGVVERISFS